MEPAHGLAVNPLSDTRTGGAIMWFGGDGIMALVMVALAIGWLRSSERLGHDRIGWVEQARIAALTERTGAAAAGPVDDDEEHLAAYNRWLASMTEPPTGREPGGH
jgi:putative copper resistance protein D